MYYVRGEPLGAYVPCHARGIAAWGAVACCALMYGCAEQAQTQTAAVPRVTPTTVRELPHDSTAFTQGLVYRHGRLYESTGAPEGRVSSIRILDTADGARVRAFEVPKVFAEGICLRGRELVMLTWRSGIAMRYSLATFKPRGSFSYTGEGWGLTTDGDHYVMSNGSDTLYVRDPSFRIVRRLAVSFEGKPLKQLNELEFASGMIYANVWFSTFLFEIDPRSGVVSRVIDCGELVRSAAKGNNGRVLNGIAWNADRGTFYVTGKDWPVMFEISLP
jgi:glutamine cyclotransferase